MRKALSKNLDVSASQIVIDPDFVTRQSDLDRWHLRALTAAVKSQGPLARVLLWQNVDAPSDAPLILLDGRYRLWAYTEAGWTKGIPALVLTCTRREAMLAATAEAIKDSKNLDPQEKADRAWRLVRDPDGEFSKAEIARATGIGSATVGRMRARWRAMVASGAEPTGCWWRDMRDAEVDAECVRGELTEPQRQRIIKDCVPKVRDAMDWRKWQPAIPDDETQFEIIAIALGEEKLRALLDWRFGGDDTLREEWRDERLGSNGLLDDLDNEEPPF